LQEISGIVSYLWSLKSLKKKKKDSYNLKVNADLKTWYHFHDFLTVKSANDLTKTFCNV